MAMRSSGRDVERNKEGQSANQRGRPRPVPRAVQETRRSGMRRRLAIPPVSARHHERPSAVEKDGMLDTPISARSWSERRISKRGEARLPTRAGAAGFGSYNKLWRHSSGVRILRGTPISLQARIFKLILWCYLISTLKDFIQAGSPPSNLESIPQLCIF
jgi:hypothetical protein